VHQTKRNKQGGTAKQSKGNQNQELEEANKHCKTAKVDAK
jgi:hypothetical protein